jgi:hypothetical protein
MKSVKILRLGTVLALAAFLIQTPAQNSDTTTHMRVVAPPFPQTKEPGAIAVTVRGACEFSKDGARFHSIKQGQLLPPGSVIRTKKTGQLDLYLKRTAVAIRLSRDTEIHLAKLEQSTNNGVSAPDTEVALTKGTIFTLERATIPGSFEITSPTGLTIASAPGGRYMISGSASDTKLFNLTKPNQSLVTSSYNEQDAKDFGQNPRDLIAQLLEFDEIQSLADTWANPDLGPAGRGTKEKAPARRK